MHQPDMQIEALEQKAGEVSKVLKLLASESRLLILCQLAKHGELSVGAIEDKVGLSQSALSQHLARLREDKLVATRRESQTIHYRIADGRIDDLMVSLYRIYCADVE